MHNFSTRTSLGVCFVVVLLALSLVVVGATPRATLDEQVASAKQLIDMKEILILQLEKGSRSTKKSPDSNSLSSVKALDDQINKIVAGLPKDRVAKVKAYQAAKVQARAQREFPAFSFTDLTVEDVKSIHSGLDLFQQEIDARDHALAKPYSDHQSMDCGFFGPYHAEISCQAPRMHANCWCQVQFLGYGNAKCECDPGPPASAGNPTITSCSIPFHEFSCELKPNGAPDGAYPVVQGNDGCNVDCPNKIAHCIPDTCADGSYTHSLCSCEPR